VIKRLDEMRKRNEAGIEEDLEKAAAGQAFRLRISAEPEEPDQLRSK